MKRYVFFCLFMATVLSGMAAERTFEQKKRAAIKAISAVKRQAMMPASGIRELKKLNELTLLGYESGGFAVISNDDRHDAVIGYSDSKIDVDVMPDGFRWWLAAADEALKNSYGYRASTSSTPADAGYRESVTALVSTQWGQGDPYNRQCPKSGTDRTLTGCVATAMAQVMNYHKYPDKAVSTSIPAYGVVLGDAYDWGNMLDCYTTDPSGTAMFNDAQANAVAMLMSHCGATVNMNYGTGASGAYTFNVPAALRTKFRYNDNVIYRNRLIHTTSEWMGMIYKELSNNRPILYGAVDAYNSGGHAFVFDGYNADGLVHVNWGWEGSADGYYDVALLNPSAGMEYSQGQDMVTGIALPGTEIESSREIGTDKSLGITLSGNKLAVRLADYSLNNFDPDNGFRGNLCLLIDDGTTIKPLGDIFTNISIQAIDITGGTIYGKSITASTEITIPDGLADGEYLVYAGLYGMFTPDVMHKVYYGEGAVGCYTLKKSGTSYTLNEGASSGMNDIRITDNIRISDKRIFSIDGRYMGNDINALGKGLYIKNGKKIAIR